MFPERTLTMLDQCLVLSNNSTPDFCRFLNQGRDTQKMLSMRTAPAGLDTGHTAKAKKGTKIGVLCSAPHFLINMLGWGNTFLSQCMRGFIARLMRAVLHSWRWASSPALCQTPSETSETERFPRSPQAVCMALVHPSLHGGDTWVDALRKSVSAFCKLLLTRRIKMIKIKMPRPPASGV